MSGTCAQCKYWIAQVISGRMGFGVCAQTISSDNRPVFMHSKVFAGDPSGFGAHMLTKDEFGCNQFEERVLLVQMVDAPQGRSWY